MEFAMESAIKGTISEDAKVIFQFIKGKGKCTDCNMEFDLQNVFDPCPNCGAFNPEVKQGKELRVKAINVD
jgi:hydrogenase nickel incorporation protein HypA/HybF